jgi:hypothetical protein
VKLKSILSAIVVAFSSSGSLLSNAAEFSIDPSGGADAFKPPSYSPYAGRNFPTRLLWGDTHLHTNLSLDARDLE